MLKHHLRIAWNVNEMFQIQKDLREELITSWEVANLITRAIFEHLKALPKLDMIPDTNKWHKPKPGLIREFTTGIKSKWDWIYLICL